MTEVEILTNGLSAHCGPEKMSEEKVEMKETATEEVPLKDTNGDAAEAKKEAKPKTPSKFLSFFAKPAVKKAVEEGGEETAATEGAEVPATEEKAVKEVKPSKARTWWAARTAKSTEPKADKKEDGLIFGLDVDHRDEKGLNDHVKLSFEDILAEPEGYHSWDCAWRLTFRVFTAVRSFIYKLLAVLIAIPCAIFWGFVFAILTLLNVWACVPAARALTIPATWLAKAWNWVVRSLLDPCFRSCGLICSSVHVRRTTEAAPPPLPTSDPALLA